MSSLLGQRSVSIVVLADDLSGAAELAGIACTLGLTAEVQRGFEPASSAEVVAVDSNTRGLPEADAVLRVGVLARRITTSDPSWIFKKVDSLLRGHPRAEIESVLSATGHERVILIPANPSRGRIVRNGLYLIDGVQLDQTPLARDPEHPRRSASIRQLLGTGNLPIHCVDCVAALPVDVIIVPDVWEVGHIQQRAGEVDRATLPAGAADFFAALLQCRLNLTSQSPPTADSHVRLPALLVCGSHTAWQTRENECRRADLPIVTIEAGPSAAATLLEVECAVVLAIGAKLVTEEQRGQMLSELANLVATILEHTSVATLLVEGGATAEAVAERLGWLRFAVCAPGPAGVGILQPISDRPAPRVLLKPGSYPWPSEIWQQLRRA